MAMAVIQQESFTFDFEHHARDSFQILDHMQKEGVLCDITLVARNVEIVAHRNVLASCSPYFYSMFTNYQTAKQERIELDVNPQVLVSILHYMYTSKLTVIEENIMDLFEVAKLLLLNGVQVECNNILKRTLRPNNCFNIKRLAANYGDSKLLSCTSSYIDDNFVDAVASDDFLNLTNDEITELISKDTLKVSSEVKVYESVVRWINHDTKGRRKYLRLLMGCVRLRFISEGYLKQHIVEESFLKGDSYCKDLIIKALLEKGTTAVQKTKPRRYKSEGRVLLVVGGSSKEASNTLEYYDFEENRWSNTLEMPFTIADFKMVTVNQNLYVIGGERNSRITRTVSYYDINTNKWNEIKSMITLRRGHGVGLLNNCIYVVGGYYDGQRMNCVEKFDIQSQQWSRTAPLLEKKDAVGVGVLNGILYVVGGDYDFDEVSRSVECYNYHTGSWRKLNSMKDCRSEVGVCVLDGKLYAIGGHDGKHYLSSVEVYSPDMDSWVNIEPMQVARARFSVVVVDNKIYAIGGYNDSGTMNSIEVYDKLANSWTILPNSMNVARMWHGAVVVDKHR